MENYPYTSSYPDSHDSSPRSESWDDQQQQQQQSSNYKVKFMCSYGGKILPRPHDNQLSYVGGDTKILSMDRNIKFSNIISKLSTICSDSDICFKYQLPGEDLDALISVTNDEDLEHMMLEYDRLYRSTSTGGGGGGGGARPARLRLFLFVLNSNNNSNQSSFSADGGDKPNQQWFVDALNSVPSIQSSSPCSTASNQDFLFGFEKPKLPDPKIELSISEPKLPDISDRNDEIQRQIQELQRLQIANQEQQQQQAMFIRKNEENLNMAGRGFQGDFFMPEKPAPTVVPVPRQMPAGGYWQDRNMSAVTGGGYSDPVPGVESQIQQNQQQPVYIVPPPAVAGRYNTPAMNVRQVTGQMGGGQGYYGVGVGVQQRGVPDVYREQPVYSMGPPPPPVLQQQQMQQQPQQVQALPQITKMMMGETGGYSTQVAFDSAGRQVYYTAPPPPPSGVVMTSSYPTAVTTVGVDPRQAGALNPDVKVVKPPL
ncbi:hypothetical protein IFM89_020501 [Coptis chinensis]|uniref:PB1 domain-containing protein n=1 Tax=Coptis chinensis TaxID=261450 RepID=A0A835LNJ4_9MAGN|nr:hypothetical protein IFM89_020501 [Coptis chinensis]